MFDGWINEINESIKWCVCKTRLRNTFIAYLQPRNKLPLSISLNSNPVSAWRDPSDDLHGVPAPTHSHATQPSPAQPSPTQLNSIQPNLTKPASHNPTKLKPTQSTRLSKTQLTPNQTSPTQLSPTHPNPTQPNPRPVHNTPPQGDLGVILNIWQSFDNNFDSYGRYVGY